MTNARTASGTDLDKTRQAQRQAADPLASAWVAANAGTGKTHVLTSRVLRLLVAGTRPERILCLTYTKAAAAEMSQRVFDRLARWVVLPEADLAKELAELTGTPPSTEGIASARDLFSVAIETPGGLKVQTIHAFCERLLQRFPLEAGIPPKFTILDDETGRQLRAEAIDATLRMAARDPEGHLAAALNTVIAWAVDDTFDALLADMLAKRDWIEAVGRLEHQGNVVRSGVEAVLRRMLGIDPRSTRDSIDYKLATVLSDADIDRSRTALMQGSTNDNKLADQLATARTASDRRFRIDALRKVFLVDKDQPRKSMVTKAVGKQFPEIEQLLDAARAAFHSAYHERTALVMLEANVALLLVAVEVMQRYTDLKQRRAALDFDDLIRRTAGLLSSSAQAQWVLYKLDGGLDHILVDEAQDTSPEQWKIVEALAAEFFSGEGAGDGKPRTLFAVGDEKQSIYGFQGAAPEKFAEVGHRFQAAAKAAGQSWQAVPLTLSFRTTKPVLDTVDRVFADPALAQQISTSGAAVRHAAFRVGAAGVVELWLPEMPEAVPEVETWAPLDEEPVALPVVRLADRIADTIKTWIENGEILQSEGRPIRAGDILILVRRRRPFAPAVVAALKARKIAVAGADRIRLADQIAMQDLLVLGDFLLLPEDDLALATVLKSPLFDLDDDDLMRVAPGRPRSLWSALIRAAKIAPKFAEAVTLLKRWRARADLLPPFEFFSEILDRDGMRARLLARLGPEAGDPIDEFLRLAISYDEGSPPSLQGFIAAIRASDREIKRDMEHGRDEVRVMTVHGAKGLEAPIVFLPDTCSNASGGRPGGLLQLDAAPRPLEMTTPFVWPVKGTSNLDLVRSARAATKDREAAERNRLLYVALTRPRDRLYVSGFLTRNGRLPTGCWYDLVTKGLEGHVTEMTDDLGRKVLRLVSPQTGPTEVPRSRADAAVEARPLPDWALKPAPREASLAVPLAPSRLAPLESDEEGDPVERPSRKADDRQEVPADPPPLAAGAQADGLRFLRGTITHALLEHLPGLAAGDWQDVANRFVEVRGADLRPRVRKSIVEETLAVLRDPGFGPIFGPMSRAEVPIVAELASARGKGPTVRVIGQIDRLVVLDSEVLIVDFKTNRPPPREVARVADAYLLQLAAYRLAVSRIYPDHIVKAALLWTDGPRLMSIPGEKLDAAELRLFAIEPATEA